MPGPHVELLVHISAPRRIQDDKVYRDQILSDLTFELGARHEVLTHPTQSSREPNLSQENIPPSSPRKELDATPQNRAINSSTGGPEIPSSSQETNYPSSYSSTVNAAPPPLLGPIFPSLSSKIDVERTPLLPQPRTAPSISHAPPEIPLHHRSFSDSWSPPRSIIPDSQPPPPSQKRSSLTSSSSSSSSYFSSNNNTVSSPSAKRTRRYSPSPLPPSQPTSSPILILPPSPPTANNPFPTSSARTLTLTPSLLLLTSRLPLANHYHPLHTTRPLRPFERGHWLLTFFPASPSSSSSSAAVVQQEPTKITSWTPDLARKFETFMRGFIGGGKAGWGVRCEISRDDGLGGGDGGNGLGGGQGGSKSGDYSFVRVWCWGESVPHVYLLLYVASERRVKGMGARWVDCEGRVVVRMA
ncbi:hypothetical protein MMC20_001484 [Loxospora ochrophaea]|nr:hypothetical protein [Loxospora ochrophaea]